MVHPEARHWVDPLNDMLAPLTQQVDAQSIQPMIQREWFALKANRRLRNGFGSWVLGNSKLIDGHEMTPQNATGLG
jgi:hypothetical protein